MKKFVEELRKIKGFDKVRVTFEKDWLVDLHFPTKEFHIIDNENSRMFRDFVRLVEKFDLEYDFTTAFHIEVYED